MCKLALCEDWLIFFLFFLVLVATAAPDQVKHYVLCLGIRMQAMCAIWYSNSEEDLGFVRNKQLCGQKELVLLSYITEQADREVQQINDFSLPLVLVKGLSAVLFCLVLESVF